MKEFERDQEYPTPANFECEWVDYESDMYPEFAPEPLRIECHEPATVIIAGFEPDGPGPWYGLPFALQFCKEHADRWEVVDEMIPYGNPPYVRVDKAALTNWKGARIRLTS